MNSDARSRSDVKKLKAENKNNGMKKTNMEIRNEAISEWKRLKTNKKEMDELMALINK